MMIAEANNKLFLDSNIILYALGDEELKRSIAFQLLQNNPYISTQVVNECSHVLRRKAKWPVQKIVDTISDILQIVQLIDINTSDSFPPVKENTSVKHYSTTKKIHANSIPFNIQFAWKNQFQQSKSL